MTYQKVVVEGGKVTKESHHQKVTDHQLVMEGTRPPLLNIDFGVFKKTKAEKELLKACKIKASIIN